MRRRALARARLGEIKPLGPKSWPVGGEVESGQCPLFGVGLRPVRWSRPFFRRVWEEDQLLCVAMVMTAP